jgi:hypothetical protein
MFTSVATLDLVLQWLIPAFTQPSFQTHVEVSLGWVMCWGKRTEDGVFQTIRRKPSTRENVEIAAHPRDLGTTALRKPACCARPHRRRREGIEKRSRD